MFSPPETLKFCSSSIILFVCDFVYLFFSWWGNAIWLWDRRKKIYTFRKLISFFLCFFFLHFILLLKYLRIKVPFREKYKIDQWLFLTTEISLYPPQSFSNFLKTKIIYSIGLLGPSPFFPPLPFPHSPLVTFC